MLPTLSIERYIDEMLRLSNRLFAFTALGLGLEEDFFASCIDRPIAQLRLLRYPASPIEPPTSPGIGAHTDYECFTLLTEIGGAGLEIDVDGTWHPVSLPTDTYVVLVGEMLTRWTEGRLRAMPHRVRSASAGRFVLAFFMSPNPDTPLRTLRTGVLTAHAGVPAMTAGEFLMSRLGEVNPG